MRVPLGFKLVFAIGAMAGASPALAQQVTQVPGGTYIVRFPNNCAVHYSSSGQQTFASQSCTNDQRIRADRAIGNYHGGIRPPGPYPGQGIGQYRVTDIRWDRVRFADDCRVYFDNLGRETRTRNRCNIQQRNIARNTMANWRRQNGYYPGGGGYRPGGQWNDMYFIPLNDGGIHIRFASNKCDVYYNRYHVRAKADSKCSRYQKRRADEAARYYRPGQRW